MVRDRSICRSVVLAVVAVLALSGIAAASALAYTNPILENAKGEHISKVKFTGGDGGMEYFPVVDYELRNASTCGPETSTGELSTTGTGVAATTSGTATLLFKNCQIHGLGHCTSNGKTHAG